jgi:hypothetical protein
VLQKGVKTYFSHPNRGIITFYLLISHFASVMRCHNAIILGAHYHSICAKCTIILSTCWRIYCCVIMIIFFSHFGKCSFNALLTRISLWRRTKTEGIFMKDYWQAAIAQFRISLSRYEQLNFITTTLSA